MATWYIWYINIAKHIVNSISSALPSQYRGYVTLAINRITKKKNVLGIVLRRAAATVHGIVSATLPVVPFLPRWCHMPAICDVVRCARRRRVSFAKRMKKKRRVAKIEESGISSEEEGNSAAAVIVRRDSRQKCGGSDVWRGK